MTTSDRFLRVDNVTNLHAETPGNGLRRFLPSRREDAAKASCGNLRGNCDSCPTAPAAAGKVIVKCLSEKAGFFRVFSAAFKHRFQNSSATRCTSALFLDPNTVHREVAILFDVKVTHLEGEAWASGERSVFPVASCLEHSSVGFAFARQSLEFVGLLMRLSPLIRKRTTES
jgi:hypothetical protein